MTHIGVRLRIFWKTQDMTQKAFAQLLGVTPGFMNDVMSGKKVIGATILINIAKVYPNFNVRWLITGEGDMYEYPNYYPPPELESGKSDKVEEGVRIEYTRPAGQLEAMQRQINDHERRLRDLEGRK